MPNEARTPTLWSPEPGQERRNTRWALIVALALHALVFRLQLPDTEAAEIRPPERPVFLVRTPHFEPPPPREQQTLPERRARRQPVPDPTPDSPEPLLARRVTVAVELPETGWAAGLPSEPPPDPPAGLLRVGGDVLPPVKVYGPPPRYTEIARKARIQGAVVVEAVIDPTGRVTEVRVVKSLPLGLDQAAVEAVGTWRFEPATWKGRPVAVLYNLTIIFRLT